MKSIRIILLALLLPIAAFPQKHELKIMYSPISLTTLDDMISNTNPFQTDKSSPGAWMLEYNYPLNDRFKIGFNITYDRFRTEGTQSYNSSGYPNQDETWSTSETTYFNYTKRESNLFLGPQISMDYLHMEKFRMGCGAGVSMVFVKNQFKSPVVTNKETDINFMGHLELLNFTWGKTNGLTGQVGFGHKGLFSLGYFVRL
ncbi:MAG: hypothetical protein ACWA6U_01680 [Breznakibacter sp.]